YARVKTRRPDARFSDTTPVAPTSTESATKPPSAPFRRTSPLATTTAEPRWDWGDNLVQTRKVDPLVGRLRTAACSLPCAGRESSGCADVRRPALTSHPSGRPKGSD